jgi:hypothetical protein
MLAEALASASSEIRAEAEFAINAISHTKRRLVDMPGGIPAVERRRGDLAFIGFQERLDTDLDRLRTYLKLPQSVVLPADDVAAHRTPSGFDVALSICDQGG